MSMILKPLNNHLQNFVKPLNILQAFHFILSLFTQHFIISISFVYENTRSLLMVCKELQKCEVYYVVQIKYLDLIFGIKLAVVTKITTIITW